MDVSATTGGTPGRTMDTDEIDNIDHRRDRRRSSGRRHAVWVYLLIVLGAVILLVTDGERVGGPAVSNTDNWVDASDQLLADPEVRTVVSTYVVDQLYANIDVAEKLNPLLPGDFSRLAGVLAASLQGAGHRSGGPTPVDAAGRRDVVSRRTDAAHETIVNILENETVPAVDTANGTVTLRPCRGGGPAGRHPRTPRDRDRQDPRDASERSPSSNPSRSWRTCKPPSRSCSGRRSCCSS